MKNIYTVLALCLLYLSPAFGNSPIILHEVFQWDETAMPFSVGNQEYERWSFRGAVISDERPDLPYLIRRFPVERNGRLQVEVVEARYEDFERQSTPGDVHLADRLIFETTVERHRTGFSGSVAFTPIIRQGGRYQRLVEVELRVSLIPDPVAERRGGPDNTTTSVLSEGALYKIAIPETGIYRLTYAFLRDELGVAVDNIDPARIQLFGNGGGMLPEFIDDQRIDDLAENHIFVAGEADGRFDPGDFILFYGEGPDRWRYEAEDGRFTMEKNVYSTSNYYFLRFGIANGQRLRDQPSLPGTSYNSSAFDDFARFEEDEANLLHRWELTRQGSGKTWYGDQLRNAREREYRGLFTFPNPVAGAPARIVARMVLRAGVPSRFNLVIGGRTLVSSQALRVDPLIGARANEVDYAHPALINDVITLPAPEVDLSLRYPYPSGPGDGSEAWLDYIELNVRRQLTLTGNQMTFRDLQSLSHPSTTFQLEGSNENTEVWEITDPLRPRRQESALTGSRLSFGLNTQQLRTFIAFNTNAELLTPEAVGRIDNQNLHGLENVDMAILYHADFEAEARRLAGHRQQHSSLQVALVRIDQLYNEFSSGRVDPTAIRDFARMLYQRSPGFRYLLLFGDGSFDPRDIYGYGNNFIPVYETESLDPILAFPSDDYFGLLENNSPSNPLAGTMSIAVGRLPVNSPEQAQAAVNKIISYDTNRETLGDWRNRLVFVGDDEDGNQHTRQADEIASDLSERYGYFNTEKIFLDAYPQITGPGGQRFPAATEAINQNIFKGALTITYLGHGGSQGWAQERVLQIPDITAWENTDRLPLFVTATCSFAGYDEATFTTAGEEAFLNPRGGAIALLTTVRAVYSSANRELTEEALLRLFERPNGQILTIGEAMQRAKNSFTSSFLITNSRKFALLGDPSLKLAMPEYKVVTTRIDEQPLAGPDTLRALQRVTIEGQVTDAGGQTLTDFNGILYPTVFDKKLELKTLGQDFTPFPYDIQKNIIFKGRASIQNGAFKFTFVVPKDINYTFGNGKISYYASDEQSSQDATGNYNSIIIGGTDPDAADDDQGPEVEVFMNTEDFVFGSVTGPSPTLLVVLRDDNGINVVGNSIGHDLEAFLNEDTQNSILLNDFYEATLDDYREGTVRYPLARLEEGRYSIRVKAWDVANNSSQGYTEFIVAPSEGIALKHVLNYPNPFTDQTCFQFDHNLAGQEIDILINIYTISGRLVKTIETTIFSDGALRRDDCVAWDGRDDFGDRLARGVYLYRVQVRATNSGNTILEGESDFEKLVLLK